MSTLLRTSRHFDDDDVLADLTKNLPTWKLEPLAILHCDSQLEYGKLSGAVAEKLGLPVVGGTSLTFPISDSEGGEISASLMLVSKDGMKHSTTVSPPLEAGMCELQTRETLEKALAGLGDKPKMLMAYFPHMPGYPSGTLFGELFAAAGDTPVFGGMTTGDLISTRAAAFSGGTAYTDRMVLLAIGGDINPVFSASNAISRISEYAPTVTKSEGNIVSRVDDMTFCRYMESIGIPPENRVNGVDALMQYGPVPVELDIPGGPDDGVPYVTCISYTMPDRGSAAFSRHIPEGTRIKIGLLTRDDIEESARRCLEGLIAETEKTPESGRSYDTLFCVSCVARYFMMVGSSNNERALLSKTIPPHLTAGGYYGFAEIGPTRDRKTGSVINRAHSASIVMCAL